MPDSLVVTKCPGCGNALEAGFCARSPGLSFMTAEKVLKFIAIDEDLVRSGLRKFLPAKAEYFRSHLCRDCEIYVIDFSTILSRKQAQELAREID